MNEQILEKLVFMAPSESKALLFVTPDGGIKYASPASYGAGFVVKGFDPEQAVLAVFSEPKIKSVADEERDNVVREYVPEDILNELGEPYYVWHVKYKMSQVAIQIVKKTERYTIVDIADIIKEAEGTAVKISWAWKGSRRHPLGGRASKVLSNLKVKLIRHKLQDKFYVDKSLGRDFRDSYLSFKKVTGIPVFEFKIPERRVPEVPETLKEKLLPDWLQHCYVLVTNFVTEYRGAIREYKVEKEKGEELKVEITKFETAKLRLRNLRVAFYQSFLRYNAIPTPIGYILYKTDDRTMQRLNDFVHEYAENVKELTGFKQEPVKLIEVYIPKKTLVGFIDEYIATLKADLEAVYKKLQELSEKERKKKRHLAAKVSFIKKILPELQKFRETLIPPVSMVSERVRALKEELDRENGSSK